MIPVRDLIQVLFHIFDRMDDFKVIIWIIIGIIYLLSRARKKDATSAPRQRQSRRTEDSQPDQPRPAPKTFEELLREIEGAKQPRRPEPITEPDVVDYDENLGPEEQNLEEVTPSYKRPDEEIYKVYESAKAQAFARPSLEETVKLEDTIVRFKQFKGYEKEVRRNVLQEYVQELRHPEGFKKAFILSEILQPRF